MTAENLVFETSANLLQSVAKILRDTQFDSLKYNPPAFRIILTVSEACLRVEKLI